MQQSPESVPRERDDGSVIWEGILVDITPLKETQDRLNTVLRAAQAYTWKVDLRTGNLTFDENWATFSGNALPQRDLTLGHWFDNAHPDDIPVARAALDALESGAQDSAILTYRRRVGDDRWIWLQVHAGISERDADGRPLTLSGVSFDITEQMNASAKAQEQQAELREELQRAQQRETIAQVAGGVAHDLNNLIAVISGTAEVLEQQAAGSPGLQGGLERIHRSVGIARDLVAGLGGLVRPELPRGAHDLGKLLRDTVDLLGQRRIARHSIRIDLAEDSPRVWANPTEVAQLLINLAINACDAGTDEAPATVRLATLPAGAVAPARRPDAGEAPSGDIPVAMFTISDTGKGITDKVRARMFRPNYSTKGKAGTGLGLPIVSTILEANRAGLWVDSTPGQGTTMTVAWPTADTAVGREPGQAGNLALALPDGVAPADLLRDLRVLVADDMADVAEVLADMLEAAGAVAVAITDPKEAAQILAEAPGIWSALVTDLHMPGMNGRALARHAASLSPPVPAVLVSARIDTLGGAEVPEFAAVLSKPVTARQLARVVREAASRRS